MSEMFEFAFNVTGRNAEELEDTAQAVLLELAPGRRRAFSISVTPLVETSQQVAPAIWQGKVTGHLIKGEPE